MKWIKLVTFIVITTLLCQNFAWAGNYEISISRAKLSSKSFLKFVEEHAGSEYGKYYMQAVALDEYLKDTARADKVYRKRKLLNIPEWIRKNKLFEVVKQEPSEAGNYIMFNVRFLDKPSELYFFKDRKKIEIDAGIGIETQQHIKITKERGYWFKVISEGSGDERRGDDKQLTTVIRESRHVVKGRRITPLRFLGILAIVSIIVVCMPVPSVDMVNLLHGIIKLSPYLAALIGGLVLGGWLIKQIKYGMDLWRKGPKYDLLDSAAQHSKEKHKEPTGFMEYEYKVITGRKIKKICQGISLSDSEKNRINDLLSEKDKVRRFMLYYHTDNVNNFAGIVTVEKMHNRVLSVKVEWAHRGGRLQLPEEFIRKELAKRKPKGIIFRKRDINTKIMDRLLPDHSPLDKNESPELLKKKIFSEVKVDDEAQCVFFVIDKQNFEKRRDRYFSSFNFSNIWEWVGKKQWIQSLANGLFYGLAFFLIFEFAEAKGILASYTFFTEYVGLFLTATLAPLAGARIAKLIRKRADPARSRHAGRGIEDNWPSAIQNMEMGWEMTKTYNFFGGIRSFSSLVSIALIPPVGVFFGISSSYVYLILMFIRFVTEFAVYIYENPNDREIFEATIRFNEVAKKKGYADNFSNIDSFNEMFRELIYACGLLTGYGLYALGMPTVVLVTLAILSAVAIPISSFMVRYKARDYKNYIKIWGEGLTNNADGSVLLADGVTMIMKPDNPNIVNPRPDLIRDWFYFLPWVERLGVTIECAPGHKPTFGIENPKRFKRLKAIKGRCILKWPKEDDLTIELVSREGPISDKDVEREEKDGRYIIKFYPKKDKPIQALPVQPAAVGAVSGGSDVDRNISCGTVVESGRGSDGQKKEPPKGSPANFFSIITRPENIEREVSMAELKNEANIRSDNMIERDMRILRKAGLVIRERRDGNVTFRVAPEIARSPAKIEIAQRILDDEYQKGWIAHRTNTESERDRIVKRLIDALQAERQKKIAERFIDTVRAGLREEKGRRTILALDTDIGNMMNGQAKELVRTLELCDMGNIRFVDGSGTSLADLINTEIDALTGKGIRREDIDVVVVTNKAREMFNKLYNVIRVKDPDVEDREKRYVPVLELLTFALKINVEEVDEDLRKELLAIYNGIAKQALAEFPDALIEQIKGGSEIPLRKPEKIDYNTSIELLTAA